MPFAADVEEEEDPLIPGDYPSEPHNKGGCSIGSTIKHSGAQELAQKKAVNYVIIKYATELWTKKGQKYAKNHDNHCNYAAFNKMYDQCEDGLVASRNAVRY
jgi:hypothetical protein